MATFFLPFNTYSPTPSRNPSLCSLKIKINRRHSPFQILQWNRSPFVRASEENSDPETVKGEISPILPKSCRYIPTCSEYSMEAYERYGVVKGTVLTAWRLCRCNPLGGHGYDPPRWFCEVRPLEDTDD